MSLTNPNTPVSQQDLQDFYHKLLPYMGGSFGMIANKFSKGDMYSTDEKMIGQWVDGKPLYQKVYTGQCPTTTGNTFVEVDGDFSGKEFKFSRGYLAVPSTGNVLDCNNGDGVLTYNRKQDGGNKIVIYLPSNKGYSQAYYNVVIAYTKTTDSAISIGDDTDYSTEEKIIGTWIDGKPLYQKTINTGAIPNNTDKLVAHGISNLDKIIYMNGYCYGASANKNRPLPFVSGVEATAQIQLLWDATNITVTTKSNLSVFTESYVTIQYTKTTS